jgi:hypothetical protein
MMNPLQFIIHRSSFWLSGSGEKAAGRWPETTNRVIGVFPCLHFYLCRRLLLSPDCLCISTRYLTRKKIKESVSGGIKRVMSDE